MKNMPEPFRSGILLQLRTRIGNGDKMLPRPICPHNTAEFVVEIIPECIGFCGGAGFAGDDTECFFEIDRLLEGRDLSRYCRVEHMQFRKTRLYTKSHPHDFGTEAAAAHTQYEYVGQIGLPNLLCYRRKNIGLRHLLIDYI